MNYSRYLWNYFIAERSYHLRSARPAGRPFVFSIETTSVCNLKCLMCPYKDMTREHEMMDDDLFRKVVDEVRDYNGMIWLHNLGEPLAHPHFDDHVRYVRRQGLPCGFSSNATLLDRARAQRIFDSGLDTLILCMDGVTRETYEKLRAGARFDEVTENIERFLRLKRERGLSRPETVIQLIFMKDTEPQVEEFLRRWRPLADRVLVKAFSTWAGQVEEITGLSEARHRYSPGHDGAAGRHPCAYLWRNVVVAANGDVIPCCADFDARLVMGNVGEESLAEIWRGERYTELRRAHLGGVHPGICATCAEWVGEPANRYYPLGAPLLSRLGAFRKRGRSAL